MISGVLSIITGVDGNSKPFMFSWGENVAMLSIFALNRFSTYVADFDCLEWKHMVLIFKMNLLLL
jgi:hypothetical protein